MLQAKLKDSVGHAGALRLLLTIAKTLDEKAAAAQQTADAEPAASLNTSATSSRSSSSCFMLDLLLQVLLIESQGDAVAAVLQSVQLPPGVLKQAPKVAVHPSKAADVARWLPQLLELGLPPYFTVRAAFPETGNWLTVM